MSIILDGTTGITTPGLTNTGTETILNLTTTGNTILGDATTDTLNVGAGGLVKDASGNVGIGTASPSYKLDVSSSAFTVARFSRSGAGASAGIDLVEGSGGYVRLACDGGTNNFSIRPAGTVTATFDSSGNLGLGVTPSTWTSGKAIEVQTLGNAIWGNGSQNIRMTQNMYYNSGYKYANTGYATYYSQNTGEHQWYTAPSGTAGNAITFTQAMTLDASGNLAIGRTSASYRLHIATTATNGTAVTGLSITNDASNSGVGAKINLGAGNGFDSTSGGVSGFYDGTGTALAFLTSSSYGVSNHTERMRINSSGNVLIGSSSLGSRTLSVTGYIGAYNTSGANDSHVVIYNDGTTSNIGSTYNSTGSFLPLAFQAGGTERMRILSNGNLLFAKTADAIGTPGIAMYTNGTLFVTRTHPDSGGAPLYVNRLNVNGPAVYFYKDSTDVGNISVTTTNTTYNTSSDYRLKENIVPMTGALAVVSALKPCTYTWKIDGSSGQGFIAHELAEVVPECVTGEKDAVELVDVKDEEGNVVGQEEKPVYQGIDTSFLVATLTAAIQELKAEFDAYKATHP